MYKLKTRGKIVATANREHLFCLLAAFNIAPPDLTLLNPAGRVVLTAKRSEGLTHAQRFDAVIAREEELYQEFMAGRKVVVLAGQ